MTAFGDSLHRGDQVKVRPEWGLIQVKTQKGKIQMGTGTCLWSLVFGWPRQENNVEFKVSLS